MAKVKSIYVCSECGFESPKWYGKCPSCGEWNTLNEELPKTEFKGNFSASLGAVGKNGTFVIIRRIPNLHSVLFFVIKMILMN